MTDSNPKDKIFRNKLWFMILTVLIYAVGRCIPVCGVDTAAYSQTQVDAETLLLQTVGGDTYRYSIFALGISPYMLSSIIVQLVMAYQRSVRKVKVSPRKVGYITVLGALAFSLYQAFQCVETIKFLPFGQEIGLVKAVAVMELVCGAMMILWLTSRNKRYGIGGQTALIFINLTDTMLSSVRSHTPGQLVLPIVIGFVGLVIMVVMENAEKKIPVQRISIHNIYADKNYMPIKLNPIGVMPIMFASSIFTLPKMVVQLLVRLMPNSTTMLWWQENMTLDHPLGIGFYVGILYLLTILFAFIMLSPADAAEQLLKGGDSLQDIHAGQDTRKYLRRSVLNLSLFSATVMSICACVPLILQLQRTIDSGLAMVSSILMMLAGIAVSLFKEVRAVRSFDSYKPFI